MPCTADNGFVPERPREHVDLIYLCFPNNPTGAVASREQLSSWVEYAHEHEALLLFDAAYEAYISQPGVPHSIFEIPGARECAVELRSFSKSGGFTGVRALIDHYMGNARILRAAAAEAGMTAFGGINAPYIWVKTPDGLTSWQMFDRMLRDLNVVITPGSGFGAQGEGYFRISAFNSRDNAEEVARRLERLC